MTTDLPGQQGTTPQPGQRRRSIPAREVAVLLTLAVLGILLAQVFLVPPAQFGGLDNPGAWNPPRSRAELLVAKMDGHTFAQIASDPTMSSAIEDYHGDEANAAYRAARPVMGWLAFVGAAGGQRDLIAPVLIVLTALSVGLMVLGTDALAKSMGASQVPLLPIVLVLPVTIAAIAYPGIADPLAIALTLFALAAWLRGDLRVAIALFCVAALARETTLIVPLGLAIDHLIRRRTLRGILGLTLPPALYLCWTAVIKLRLGAWPSDYSQLDGPLVGFRQGFPNWRPAEWAAALVLVGSAVVLLRWGPGWTKAITGVLAVFYIFPNYQVWWVWLGFGRVGSILPMLALVVLAVRRHPQIADQPEDSPIVRNSPSRVDGPNCEPRHGAHP